MLSNADVDCYHTGQPPLHIAIEVFVCNSDTCCCVCMPVFVAE